MFVVVLSLVALYIDHNHALVFFRPETFTNWLNEQKFLGLETKGRLSDKLQVKAFARENGVSVVETIFSTKDPEQLRTFEFPAEQGFALKSSSGSGCNTIVKPGAHVDVEHLIATAHDYMQRTPFRCHPFQVWTGFMHEPQYALNDRTIMVDRYVERRVEYKFFVIRKVIAFVQIDIGDPIRYRYICDRDFEHLSTWRIDHDQPPYDVEKPAFFDEMREIATRLAERADVSFVRVDMIHHENEVRLTEMTFTPAACRALIRPKSIDSMLYSQYCVEC